jgi:hypothetical protein
MVVTVPRHVLRQKVLDYLGDHQSARVRSMADELRKDSALRHVRDADVRSVVLSMMVTGTLSHDADLRIRVGSTDDPQ